MKIAVGGIHTECSTYSPVVQTTDDFLLTTGDALLHQVLGETSSPEGVQLQPLFHARSIPGGPVTSDCYEAFKVRFLKELQATGPHDAVLLLMHGAMHVSQMEDVEGDWISVVRHAVGDKIPIAVSYDLHGNVTQKIIDQIDVFCAYRTAPHIDVRETHQRALNQLVAMLKDREPRYVAWAPIPVLLPGEKTSTVDEPAQSLYKGLCHDNKLDGVTDANLMVGYVWADTKRATAAAVVTGTDPVIIAKSAERIAARYWESRRDFTFGVPALSLKDAIKYASKLTTSPIVLADSGDNPTGGGVGDRTDLLKLWLDEGMKGGVFAGITAPSMARSCAEAGVGASIDVVMGAELGSKCPKVSGTAIVKAICGAAAEKNREVAIDLADNIIILTEQRRPFHHLSDIEKFGIELADARTLIVKAGYLVTEIAGVANPAIMALTEGAVQQDHSTLEINNRSKPTFPFETDFEFTPKAHLSARVSQKP
ncbi:MlrC domain-containing protein [Roseibium sp. TrichSKD4]|uniref:M81 family metallopeptidase n=1 Tax=Roseibium sp. TrichSKD4 TaxID=744980 RepID=UPI0001E5764F|nr:M81 family metallopeptidase [Roseibium sp. TrichSKD4]EFO30035.1 MlrC domain-containing protein [Roseibium sp. TrichSKD4]